MNRKQTYNLIILSLITALVVPAGLLAVPAAPTAANFHHSAAVSPVLSVVAAPATAVVAVTAQSASFCSLATLVSSNLVQEASLINLNQSADCFTIQNAQLSVSQQLAVTHAISTATVAVTDNSATNWNQVQSPEPLPAAVPALPAVGLVLLVVSGVLTFDLVKRKQRHQPCRFVQVLSLSQLQVMRC
jgi:hypothetical protein